MLWVACARKLKKTREKKIRVAKFDNSDNGASGDTELFEKTSNINGFGLSDNFLSCISDFPRSERQVFLRTAGFAEFRKKSLGQISAGAVPRV